MIVKKIKTTSIVNWLSRGWDGGKSRFQNYFKNGGDDFLYVLNSVSLLSPLLLGGTTMVNTVVEVPAWLMSYTIFASIFLGLYVVVSIAENVFSKYLTLKSTVIFWTGAVAFVGYLAHGQAIGEVSSIFGQDASSLPSATIAATAMQVAK